MGNYIYQISDVPIKENEVINEDNFGYTDCRNTYIDCATNVNQENAIDNIIERMSDYANINKDAKTIIFHKDAKEKYFNSNFDKLKITVKKLTLEKFSQDTNEIHNIKELVESYYDAYVYSFYYQTLDNFMREMIPGQVYYIGGIVWYK